VARHWLTLFRGTVSGASTRTGQMQVTMDGVDAYTVTLSVSDASGAATDTLDVYVDGLFGGVVVNLIHFPVVLGNGGPKVFTAVVMPPSIATTANVLDVTTDNAAGQLRIIGIPGRMRARVQTSGNGSFTVLVHAVGT